MSSSKQGEMRRGAWSKEEDEILSNYVKLHGHAKWRSIARNSGLKRCGKSCRLRWINYLRPDIKRGDITADEEDLIIRLHQLLGNRWSLIAGRLPGRTDNEIKNYWNSKLMKKHNKTHSSSSGCNNNTTIIKSEEEEEEDSQKTPELDTPKLSLADDNDHDHAAATLVKNHTADKKELETNNKVINPNGVMNFLSSENNVDDFLADIGCSFASVVPDMDDIPACSSAQGYINIWEEDDAKLHEVDMMNMDYTGDGDLTLLDIELKKLASFLDLD